MPLVIELIFVAIFIIIILSIVYIPAIINAKRYKKHNETVAEIAESIRKSQIMSKDVEKAIKKQKIAQETALVASNMYDRFDMLDFEE